MLVVTFTSNTAYNSLNLIIETRFSNHANTGY